QPGGVIAITDWFKPSSAPARKREKLFGRIADGMLVERLTMPDYQSCRAAASMKLSSSFIRNLGRGGSRRGFGFRPRPPRKVDTPFCEQVLGRKVIPGRNTRRKLFTGSITSASVGTLWQGVIHAQAFQVQLSSAIHGYGAPNCPARRSRLGRDFLGWC